VEERRPPFAFRPDWSGRSGTMAAPMDQTR
jgi:hypothetical protein